jgi:hypothetical protein
MVFNFIQSSCYHGFAPRRSNHSYLPALFNGPARKRSLPARLTGYAPRVIFAAKLFLRAGEHMGESQPEILTAVPKLARYLNF